MEHEKKEKNVKVELEKSIVNIETEDVVIITPKKKIPKGVRWFMGFQELIEELSTDKELDGVDLRILLFLIANMDFENWIQVSQKTISKKLKINIPNISRTIKKLKNKKIIEVAKRGRMNIYRLNPEIAWKGSYKELQKYYENVLSFPKET